MTVLLGAQWRTETACQTDMRNDNTGLCSYDRLSKIIQKQDVLLIPLLPSAGIMLPSLEWVQVIVSSLSALIALSQLTADTKHVSQKFVRMSLL